MEQEFSNQVVLITGGTGALGSVVSESFLNYSPKSIIITYRTDSEMVALRSRLLSKLEDNSTKGQRTEIEFMKSDITNELEVTKLVSHIIEKLGQIHILVNLVGGYIGGKGISKIKESEWDKMMNVNLKSAYLITKHVLPTLIKNRFGKIVHIASATGLRARGNDSAYAVSKAGLIRMVESVAEEVKEMDININCILPTIIDTEPNRMAMPSADYSKWVTPMNLSKVIIFLCSKQSKLINGAAIPTYGKL